MKPSPTFADFRSFLATKGKHLVDDPRMCLGQEGRYSLRYMPFESSSLTAKLVIVGITPGTTQLEIAYDSVQRLTRRRGCERLLTDAEILAEVKRLAGFGGPMRENLLRMLRHFQVGPLIGVADELELWGTHASALHATSIVPHAAFIGNEMFALSFGHILRSDLLRGCFERDFVPTLSTLPQDSRFIALGRTPLEGLEWCAREGYLSPDRILGAFAHPSGGGGSQVAVYLGLKDPATLHPRDPVRNRVPWLLEASARMQDATSCSAVQPAAGHSAPSASTLCPARPQMNPSARLRQYANPVRNDHTAPPPPKSAVGQHPLSRLGIEVEEAVATDPRYIRYRNHAYMCTFRTHGGTVFAFERKTVAAINLWLPPTPAIEAVTRKEGVVSALKAPWPKPGTYGRLSALKSVPELRDHPLLVVPIRSASKAMRILAALP